MISAEPRSAPSIAGRPSWKDSEPALTKPVINIATANELCMIAASAIPAKVALNLAFEPVTNLRKDAPKARSTPVRTILTANKRRMVAPASSSKKLTVIMRKYCQIESIGSEMPKPLV